jgi:hypothetical protein
MAFNMSENSGYIFQNHLVAAPFCLSSQDIDECSPSSGIFHGCEMKCENYPGGYNCSCDEGFYLATDGEKCSGMNYDV